MRRFPAIVLGGFAAGLAAGCNLGGIDCPALAAPAILLEVREQGTGFPAAHDARGIVRDGSYQDSLRLVGWEGTPGPATELQLAAAFDRPGTYDITLEKPGYQTWLRNGVEVGSGRCGTEQVQLAAILVPVP